jgi:hypothetical protein
MVVDAFATSLTRRANFKVIQTVESARLKSNFSGYILPQKGGHLAQNAPRQ